jgi:hypothetical protein
LTGRSGYDITAKQSALTSVRASVFLPHAVLSAFLICLFIAGSAAGVPFTSLIHIPATLWVTFTALLYSSTLRKAAKAYDDDLPVSLTRSATVAPSGTSDPLSDCERD